jgi:hypothetical protein
MKTKDKAELEKSTRNKRLSYVAIVVILILVLASILFFPRYNQTIQPKAAIIDQLSSSQLSPGSRYPNQTFVETATELLYKRFSVVDYYSDNATVENYKRLASDSYKLIIWRAHSALALSSKYIAISTSEVNDTRTSIDYSQYTDDGQLTLCNITGDTKYYFAITPSFIAKVMSGRFEDTVIILMSCNGLARGYDTTAQAFEEKGAKVFISWDGWINSSKNDDAIALLLRYLIDENNTIEEAILKIPPQHSSELGDSTLKYDPVNNEVSNYRIPNYKQTNVASNMGSMAIVILKKTKPLAVLGSRCWLNQAGSLNVSSVLKQSRIIGREEHHLLN